MRYQSGVRALLALVILAVPASLSAQDAIRGIARLGGDYGGEKVLEFEYQDGSTPDVTAGGGILFTGGAELRVARLGLHELGARVTGGVKYRTIPPATNQEATWLRFPVEAMAVFRTAKGFGLAGGVVAHLRNALEVSGDAASGRVEFKTAPGFALQGEYRTGALGFDLRYTSLTYEISNGGTGKIDASGIGGGMSYYFGGQRKVVVGP